MAKNENASLPSTQRSSTIIFSWGVFCATSIFICSILAYYTFTPFSNLWAHQHLAINQNGAKINSIPMSGEVKRLPSPQAEELLVESLTLLQDILVHISEGRKSDSNPEENSGRLVARGLISDITGLFTGGIGNLLASGAGDASKYLGVGIANGTIDGLNLPPAYLQKNAATSSKSPTGINLIAQNLGQGLSSSLVGSLNVSALLPGTSNLAPTSRALAQGLGSGASAGLGLKPLDEDAFNSSGIPGIAGNFGQGLTNSFLQDIDLKQLVMSSMTGLDPRQANKAALSLAQGLGGGAAFASKLSAIPPNTTFDQSGIGGIAGNVGQGLSTSFIQGVDFKKVLASSMGMMSPEQANKAALSLAQGLGGGAAFASKLSAIPPNTTFDQSGIGGIAGNVGQGLSTSFIQGVDFKKVLASSMGMISPEQANKAALSLAQGLGGGAAFASKLSTVPPSTTFDQNGIGGIAGNVGQGLSTSFIQGVDFKKVLASSMGMISPEQVNKAALSLAEGLGGGAAFALNLSTVPPSGIYDQSGISGITGNVGQGLSTSFIQNIDFKKSLANAAPKFSQKQAMDVAEGLGSGLASGAVIGIGLQPASNFDNKNTDMNEGMGPVAQSFGRGLSISFVSNGTVAKLITMFGQQKQPSNINVSAVAKGFAIGLVDGAQSSIDDAGGFDQILNMNRRDTSGNINPSAQISNSQTEMSNYDDSVGGTAVGFGNGLGMETIKNVIKIFGKSQNTNSNSTKKLSSRKLSNTTKRDVDVPQVPENQTSIAGSLPDSVNSIALSDISGLNTSQVSSLLNPLLQKGVNFLGCQGVGGLITIIHSSGLDSNVNQNDNVDMVQRIVKRVGLENQTLSIRDQNGNKFEINVAKFLIYLNGNDLKTEIFTLTTHITLAINAFFIIIPMILIINSIRKLAIMNGRVNTLKNSTKIQWIMALAIILPSLIAIIALGIVAEGHKRHFFTPHGILGIVLIILVLTAYPLAYLRSNSNSFQLGFKANLIAILILSLIELITGFIDLSNLTFCILQIIPQFIILIFGFLITAPFLQGITLLTIVGFLKKWKSQNTSDLLDVNLNPDSEKIALSRENSLKSFIRQNNDKSSTKSDVPDNFMI